MKPTRLLCFSTLLLRNSPLSQHSKVFFFPFQSIHQSQPSCSRPTLPWFKGNSKRAQCENTDTTTGQQSSHRPWHSMADSGLDYSRHNVRRLRDLACGGDAMDVVVAGKRQEATEHVIFFGGDVQDYPESMQSHRDNGKYVRWNSLSTAGRLCERFPSAMVLTMKPHHMHLKTFSVYSQFVQSNDFGCPTHAPDFGAWQNLLQVYGQAVSLALAPAPAPAPALSNSHHQSNDGQHRSGAATAEKADATSNSVQNAAEQSKETVCVDGSDATHPKVPVHPSVQNAAEQSKETVCVDGSDATRPKVSVHLMGFSKGCIVLNQLVHELESVQSDDAVQIFLARVHAVTWLDGGHSGGSNTWVTDQAALGHLATLGVNIHVHVTPYQVKDPMRRWIGKEKQKFVEKLRKAGAKVTDKLHFEDEPRSIENHFRVLENF